MTMRRTAPSSGLPLGLLLLTCLVTCRGFAFQPLGGSHASTLHKTKAATSAPDDVSVAKRTAALMVPPLPSRSRREGKGEGGQTQLGASPTFYLARFAMALVPSSVTALGIGFGALAPALVAPVPAVHAQTDTDFKIKKGSASTLNSGTVKTMTRGVNIENANFEGKDLTAMGYQMGNFKEIVAAANKLAMDGHASNYNTDDLSNADFTGANMDQANLELANLKGAIFKDAMVREAYVSGATRLTDIQIEGSDWSGTFLRKDQQTYLCKRASGVNPITKISTKESLLCPE